MEITECFGKNRHGEKGLIVTKLISDKCALEEQIKHVILSLSKYERSSFKSEEYKTLVRERVKLELKYKRVLAELQKYDDKKSISEIELSLINAELSRYDNGMIRNKRYDELIKKKSILELKNIQTRRNILTEVFQRDFQNYMDSRKSGDEKKIKEAKLRMMESKKKLNEFEKRVEAKINNLSKNSYNGGRSK